MAASFFFFGGGVGVMRAYSDDIAMCFVGKQRGTRIFKGVRAYF